MRKNLPALHVHVQWKHSTMPLDSHHQSLGKQYVANNYSILSFIDFSAGFSYNSSLAPVPPSRSSCCTAPRAGMLPALPQCSHLILGTHTVTLQTPWLLALVSQSTAPCLNCGYECFTHTTAVLGN